MLSRRLKQNNLHEDVDLAVDRLSARKTLDALTKDLITCMVTIERDGVYEREEIENYVIHRIEAHESRFYGMDDEELGEYLENELTKRLMERLVL